LEQELNSQLWGQRHRKVATNISLKVLGKRYSYTKKNGKQATKLKSGKKYEIAMAATNYA
jgi:hypothetical protein